MEKKNLKEFSIEEILKNDKNKFRSLVIIMRETRRILKEIFEIGVESPGKKAISEALSNFEKGEVETRKVGP
ncbi:MAG: hypothetical protein ABDH37_00300 [Candidatus Hydrothermales bacterium]